ncbi:MAG: sulfite exporter TauE/SafE family protein [Pseudanabaenaceae cyanobacterium]
MITNIVGHILGLIIGISLGLIGGGGSILATPVLIYVMQVEKKAAIAMTLVIVGVASVIGVISHWLQKNVNWQAVVAFSPSSMVGAYLGARVATLPFVIPEVQLVILGVMMVIAAIGMIRRKPEEVLVPVPEQIEELAEAAVVVSVPAKKDGFHIPRWLKIALEGFGVGFLSGLVGIGGGFLVIPALVLLGNLPMKEAVGTSLVIIALKSATGFAGYFGSVTISTELMVSFTFVASLGIILGSYLSRFVSAEQLEKGFGYFVLAVAAIVLIKR